MGTNSGYSCDQTPPRDAAGRRTDGPTIEAWVRAGYPAGYYPPHDYAELPSDGLAAYRAWQADPHNAALHQAVADILGVSVGEVTHGKAEPVAPPTLATDATSINPVEPREPRCGQPVEILGLQESHPCVLDPGHEGDCMAVASLELVPDITTADSAGQAAAAAHGALDDDGAPHPPTAVEGADIGRPIADDTGDNPNDDLA